VGHCRLTRAPRCPQRLIQAHGQDVRPAPHPPPRLPPHLHHPRLREQRANQGDQRSPRPLIPGLHNGRLQPRHPNHDGRPSETCWQYPRINVPSQWLVEHKSTHALRHMRARSTEPHCAHSSWPCFHQGCGAGLDMRDTHPPVDHQAPTDQAVDQSKAQRQQIEPRWP